MLCKTKKKNTFVTEISKGIKNVERSLRLIGKRRGARVVEEARLESVYTPKAYHGFESRTRHHFSNKVRKDFFFYPKQFFSKILRKFHKFFS